MTQEQVSSEQHSQENTAKHATQFATDVSRMVMGTACEVLGGISHASAEAFKTVNSHLSAEKPNVVEGVLKGNARFLEEISHTMEAVAERLRPRPTASTTHPTCSDTTAI
jgi:hypothetical protein